MHGTERRNLCIYGRPTTYLCRVCARNIPRTNWRNYCIEVLSTIYVFPENWLETWLTANEGNRVFTFDLRHTGAVFRLETGLSRTVVSRVLTPELQITCPDKWRESWITINEEIHVFMTTYLLSVQIMCLKHDSREKEICVMAFNLQHVFRRWARNMTYCKRSNSFIYGENMVWKYDSGNLKKIVYCHSTHCLSRKLSRNLTCPIWRNSCVCGRNTSYLCRIFPRNMTRANSMTLSWTWFRKLLATKEEFHPFNFALNRPCAEYILEKRLAWTAKIRLLALDLLPICSEYILVTWQVRIEEIRVTPIGPLPVSANSFRNMTRTKRNSCIYGIYYLWKLLLKHKFREVKTFVYLRIFCLCR